ncbi:MAG: biopolymer transporter ExbD [bacterium]|nr:biopolymer transporter ExbD [bacterium]
MNFRHKRTLQNDEINLTPMIDVVFNLLIFFMVTTTFDETKHLDIKLPGASGGKAAEKNEPVTLSIDSKGTMTAGDMGCDSASLEKNLCGLLEKAKSASLVINADQETPHHFVVKALDTAQNLGVQKLEILARALNEIPGGQTN